MCGFEPHRGYESEIANLCCGSLVDDTQETSMTETGTVLRSAVRGHECPTTITRRVGCVGTHIWLVKQARKPSCLRSALLCYDFNGTQASLAELAYATHSKCVVREGMWVRVPREARFLTFFKSLLRYRE